jgi:hypothetical protein
MMDRLMMMWPLGLDHLMMMLQLLMMWPVLGNHLILMLELEQTLLLPLVVGLQPLPTS